MDNDLGSLDGSGPAVLATEVVFNFDGTTYRLALCPSGRAQLHAILAPYITAGRRIAAHRAAGSRTA